VKNDDNWVEQLHPLKGPLMGRGKIVKAVKLLDQALLDVENGMASLIAVYNATFNRPRLFNLTIIRRGYPLLWWREAKSSGTYVRPFQMDDVLEDVPKEVYNQLRQFEVKRLTLNLQSSNIGHSRESYARFRQQYTSVAHPL